MPQIKQTNNYESFKTMNDNRVVIGKHVRQLARSMGENPQMFQHRPILVNDRMEVIDGQHRLEAAKMLGIPVWYTEGGELDIAAARRLNANQKSWSPEDYARSFAENGNRAYQKYLEYRQEYGLGHRVTVLFMEGRYRNSSFRAFRDGTLEFPNPEQTENRLSAYQEIAMLVPEYAKLTQFTKAAFYLIRSENYDHGWFLNRLERQGERYLKKFANANDYLRAIEQIYNHNLSEANRIRVF